MRKQCIAWLRRLFFCREGEVERGMVWFARLLLFSLLVLFFALAWQYSHRTRTVTIGIYAGSAWGVPQGDAYAFFDDVIRRYEAHHPGVKVRYVSGITPADYHEWLSERFLAGDEPDVFLVAGDALPDFTRLGAVADLTHYMEGDKTFSRDAFFPAGLAYGEQNGHAYALPLECVPTLMFVNKTLLSREGIPLPRADWTWEDFWRICRAVTRDTDGDGVIDQYGCYDLNWREAAVMNDCALFREDGRSISLTGRDMSETIEFLRELNGLTGGYEVTARDFDLGRVAFRPLDFAQYRTYQPYPWRIKKYSTFDWECVPMPRGPSGIGAGAAPMQTLLAAMSARTREPELAWDLLKELTNEESGRFLLKEAAGLPSRRDVLQSQTAAETLSGELPGGILDTATLARVMESGRMPPRFPRYEDAMMRVDNGIERILRDDQFHSEDLSRLQREINVYLSR